MVVDTQGHAPPLFGRNWLHHFKLDWGKFLPLSAQHRVSKLSIENLKSNYADTFAPGLGTVKGVKASLHVKYNARPIFHKARPVPFALRQAVDDELQRMQDEGIIYPVDFSEWATPLVCVPKPNGKVRLCGDYKVTVNTVLHTDQHPIPLPEEVLAKITPGEKFSKIDLKSAYQQLMLDDKSQEYVTINTSRGLFRYTRLPFGTSSSPAIWQRFIDQALQGLDGVCVIQDDVIVTGKDDDTHLANLEKLFQRFTKYGLRLNPDKCAFLQDKVVFFAIQVSKDGIQPTDDKVPAVRDAPAPTNVTELRSWLGLLNFHARYLPNISTVLHPLHELLGSNKKWQWTAECDKAFAKAKSLLMTAPVLVHYDPSQPLYLAVDASPYGLGAAIMHDIDGVRRPIAYASQTLNSHEKNYAQLDKEAAAIMFGIQKFRMFIYGRHFVILSDHKPLEYIFGSKKAIPTLAAQRLQRWAIALSAFDYTLKHVSAKDNLLADGLSRLPLPDTAPSEDNVLRVEELWLENLPVTSKQICEATRKHPVLLRVLEFTQTGWPHEVDDERLKPFFRSKAASCGLFEW